MGCKKLSTKAQEIFKRLESYFPPDPYKNPHWKEEGLVYDNSWFDLREKSAREFLEGEKRRYVGYLVILAASAYRRTHGSLSGFNRERYTKLIQHEAEILLLLQDLDFQIETLDLVES